MWITSSSHFGFCCAASETPDQISKDHRPWARVPATDPNTLRVYGIASDSRSDRSAVYWE